MKSFLVFICVLISSSNIDYSTVWPEDFRYAVEPITLELTYIKHGLKVVDFL